MHILVATDGSGNAQAAVDLLAEWSPANREAYPVTVLSVVADLPLLGSDLEIPESALNPEASSHRETEIAEQLVDSVCRSLSGAGYQATPQVRAGKPADEVLACAGEIGADIIILGIQGIGRVRRLVAGSVATRVARLATVPVLLADQPASLSPMLIAVDGSSSSERVITTVLGLPPGTVEHTTLLHVTSEDVDPGSLHPSLSVGAELLEIGGIPTSQIASMGNEVDQILRIAESVGARAIAMGASTRKADGEPILGSTVNGVIGREPCTILIAR
ncbi:universal stress protein [soil metagenome]